LGVSQPGVELRGDNWGPDWELGSNGGQGYRVEGVSSSVKGGWLAGWCWGLAGLRG